MRYLPHTDADVERMLRVIGKPSVASLFDHVPAALRARRPLDIAPLDEASLLGHLGDLGARSQPAVGATSREGAALSFLGGGLIPHHIPTAVDALLTRAEWYTSYTPYQPEISQGTLQAIFEYQTLVAELLGLDVANASMYDGASAAAEAVLMARRVTGRTRAVLAGTLHPHYAQTISTYSAGTELRERAAMDVVGSGADGRVSLAALDQRVTDDTACVVVQSPNFFGVIEDLRPVAELAHARGALLVAAHTEPLAFGVLEPPGALGADIAVGEGIGLATPPTLGGPGVGLFAARGEHVRAMPGRLVGETVDAAGRRGFVLTLATREQHIRRERATSNICTNTGLVALAFTIHLCLLGRSGLAELARLNLAKTEYCKRLIASLRGFQVLAGPTFNEFTVRVRGGDSSRLVERLAKDGILAGVPAGAPGLLAGSDDFRDLLLIAVTERHSKPDIERLARALENSQVEG